MTMPLAPPFSAAAITGAVSGVMTPVVTLNPSTHPLEGEEAHGDATPAIGTLVKMKSCVPLKNSVTWKPETCSWTSVDEKFELSAGPVTAVVDITFAAIVTW